MLFCKEQTCKSLAVVGGYCLSHQLERANELYAQLNQRNDSCSRMSREITERIANESQLEQRATTAERERDEACADLERVKAERDAAIKASHELGYIIRMTRVGWDNTVTCEGVLEPINACAKAIGAALGIEP